MKRRRKFAALWLILSFFASMPQTLADCECGYSIITSGGGDDDDNTQVFTNLLEADFIHIDYVGEGATRNDWATQTYNMSSQAARGSYGESFVATGVQNDLVKDANLWTNDDTDGDNVGLRLMVRSETVNGMIQGGQVATTAGDYFWGSYRASIKVTAVQGTCSAFFWYFNDTQEIDLEFLSKDFSASGSHYPVNLVLQSPRSRSAGYDASGTGTFINASLPFDPTADFHEYRFDFLAGRVLFYADGDLLATMDDSTGAVPKSSGNLILSHWSNGNAEWSGGPPNQDAASIVRYVKAYYNASSPARRNAAAARCVDPTASAAVCAVPEGNATFFFMYQDNMTAGQAGADGNTDSGATAWVRRGNGSSVAFSIALLAFMWVCGLI
ncbi:hypothetical protein PFICI_05889 [Pestalotiopsis fici W106-1]|uniref:GH16 domain-containing protein n=1 Tax=Pestalotiopsis fici (strain W106-1 / CGMCC3.15140) TaxID=1229662 RepID=W3XD40_PESFW|nr:uncharacterized protein PFICI_05889 [Pestalotiopsis fici W106-1]ETS84013.1 hypothetical protein PFICI_05889 [Pestalotiopsis fici W106-1]